MLRRTLLRFATAFGLSIAALSPGFALDRPLTPEEQQLLGDISSHNSAIPTMVGRFEQIDGQGNRVEGTFFLERPNKIRFRYNPPSREEIVSVGRGFYILDRREKTSYAYPQDKVPLRQFLTDEIDLLNANIVDMVTSDNFVSVTIADESPIGTVQVSLIFDRESRDLRQWTLVEPSGEETTVSVFDVQTGVEIPRSYFYIDPTYSAPAQ